MTSGAKVATSQTHLSILHFRLAKFLRKLGMRARGAPPAIGAPTTMRILNGKVRVNKI
jgi:hypothetical protein